MKIANNFKKSFYIYLKRQLLVERASCYRYMYADYICIPLVGESIIMSKCYLIIATYSAMQFHVHVYSSKEKATEELEKYVKNLENRELMVYNKHVEVGFFLAKPTGFEYSKKTNSWIKPGIRIYIEEIDFE